MTNRERREQAISFVYGNLALMRKYRDATPDVLASLRALATATVDDKHPEYLERPDDTE